MLLDATVIGEGYRVLVFLFWWVLLCAFFFCMGDGVLLAWDGGEPWSFKSLGCHHLILLPGRVSLGVFLVVLDTPGWRTDAWARRLGMGGFGKVFFWGGRVVDSERCK